MPSVGSRTLWAAVLAALVGLYGCGGAREDPRRLLDQGRRSLDNASAVHFRLQTSGLPPGATVLAGGEGDLVRPASFRGRLLVGRGDVTFPVEVVAVGKDFWAKPAFTKEYARTDPSRFGFGNPTTLLDPHRGVTRLLTEATQARFTGRQRYEGEVLDDVEVRLPGSVVAGVLADADPARDVRGTVALTEDSHEVRRVVLTGPFYATGRDSTFTLVLDRYGERVEIRAPG